MRASNTVVVRGVVRGVLLGAVVMAASSILGGCATYTEPVAAHASVIEGQYVNFAWSRTFKGFFVDSTGSLYTFDLKGEMWNPSDPEHPTSGELYGKYGTERKFIRVLSSAETAELFQLAAATTRNSLTAPKSRCADAGTLTFSVYRDMDKLNAERVLLRSEGDVIQENTSTPAKELAGKLIKLGILTPIPGCQPQDVPR